MLGVKSKDGDGAKAATGKGKAEPLAEPPMDGSAAKEATARLIELARDRAAEADYLGAVALIRKGADIRARDSGGKTAHDHYTEHCARDPDHMELCYPSSALLDEVLRKGDIFSDPDFNPAHFA